ncbi:MAG: HAMP domain-containing protein [Methylococcaceae bacterium]|nr:HAMP domain-containing protein [Methylococcaceae bacterium]
MQIRRILLISFFLLLSIVALPLTTLSFFGTRNSLQEEIGRHLTSDAAMLMEEVDMLMFERLQNVHSWSRLDTIREMQIGDENKRLSQFLTDVEAGYKGMYRNLFYVDTLQRVIAASAPELIGHIHYTTANWVKAEVPNGEVLIEDLQLTPPYNKTNLVIRAPVYDKHTSKNRGHLYGLFDMQQLFHLLDKASGSSSGERFIVLLDGEGRTLAASSSLRTPQFLLKNTFANWKPNKGEALFVHSGDSISNSPVLVGYASSTGYLGYAQLGWSVLIFQNIANAFSPVRSLWLMFTAVIISTLLLAFFASHWISGRIAKPLLSLTAWVRQVRHSEQQTPPQVGGTVEIRELETAFGEMLQELELSREHVIQATKLAVVGEMAAIMAHEVRTPLGILSTSAQWLQEEQALSPEGKEMTQFILEESNRLKKLVTTLLECARPRAPEMLHHNIHDLIAHSVELLASQANKKHLNIQQHLLAHNPFIACDAELLTQVFLNLLLNAIQILPDHGIIRIRSTTFGQRIDIEFADNGPGIAYEDYHRLFDPFFTKREGGIGLGLTVTQQIITAHQGKISAIQSDWGGACFFLRLPLTQE